MITVSFASSEKQSAEKNVSTPSQEEIAKAMLLSTTLVR